MWREFKYLKTHYLEIVPGCTVVCKDHFTNSSEFVYKVFCKPMFSQRYCEGQCKLYGANLMSNLLMCTVSHSKWANVQVKTEDKITETISIPKTISECGPLWDSLLYPRQDMVIVHQEHDPGLHFCSNKIRETTVQQHAQTQHNLKFFCNPAQRLN